MPDDLSNNGSESIGGETAVGSRSRVILAPKWLGKRVGRFKLLALLGQGAMGRVFRAEDTLMQRHVALKLLPRTVKRGGNSVGGEMLIREARAAASIEHPGAVQIYEINEAGDVYYIAMELLEGGSLRDLVKAAGPLDVTRACLLAAEAAETLSYAHSIGVVHRDVKPANLMLNRAGRCKVVDFGLARVDDPSDLTNFLAESVGTPQFIAPEILTGTPASAQSDMYSLGGTVWYLLTGHPPFEAGTSQELLQKHINCPLADLRSIRPDVPQGLADALARSLAKRPGERYPSMDQFAKVLRVHTIPLAASAADMEAMATSGIIPPPAPQAPQFPAASEATAAPVYAVPPSPIRATPSVSRPASPLDSRPASPVTRPSSPMSRPARPATPFDEAPVEEAPAEEPIETAAEEEPAPESIEYAVSPVGSSNRMTKWVVISGIAVAAVIGIVIACVVLLRPSGPDSTNTSQATPIAPSIPRAVLPPVLTPVASSGLGDFEGQTDIGAVGHPGDCVYSAADHRYMVTGSGADIYGKVDAFHFVWQKVSGDASLTARIDFVGVSKERYRKACLMFRGGLEADAACVDVAVHGDNGIAVQWRSKPGAMSSQASLSTKNPAVVQIERHGNSFTVYAGKVGKPLKKFKTIKLDLDDSAYIGLAVCSHNAATSETATFSQVTLTK
jgi:serine/threonine protein kinase